MKYFALLDGKQGNHGIVVPDLPGCTSAGKTADAAYRNAIAAVRLWVEDALADGETLPRARSLAELLADRQIRRALAAGAALLLLLAAPANAQQSTFHDPAGRVTGSARTDTNGVTIFHDRAGRVTGTARTDSNGVTTFRDAAGRTTGSIRK